MQLKHCSYEYLYELTVEQKGPPRIFFIHFTLAADILDLAADNLNFSNNCTTNRDFTIADTFSTLTIWGMCQRSICRYC